MKSLHRNINRGIGLGHAVGFAVALLCCATSAHAVGLELFDVGAFAGARVGGSVDLPAEQTTLSLDPQVSFGAMADINVYDIGGGNVFIEVLFGYSKTKLKAETVTESDLHVDDIASSYYHGGVGYQWKFLRWRPYAIFTLGATNLSTDGLGSSTTDFSYAFGGGLKYQFLLNFGVRGDVRWYGTQLDLGDTDWICGNYNCFRAENKPTLWQTDITLTAFVSF